MHINFISNKLPIIKKLCPKLHINPVAGKSDVFIEITPDMFEATILRPDFEKINTPIANEAEYKTLLAKLKNTLAHSGNHAYFTKNDLEEYGKVDLTEHGLIPYCGFDDCHLLINTYLSGRLSKVERDIWKHQTPCDLDTIPEVIRLLEYSLKVLDKKHGHYSGIVYRQGIMSETPNQFISTSINPYIAAGLYDEWFHFTGNKKYSVIKVENGHKILEFQREAGVGFAKSEAEILLSFRNKYEKLSDNELSEELVNAKEFFARSLFKGSDLLMSGKEMKINGYTKKDVLSKIDVYVQK